MVDNSKNVQEDQNQGKRRSVDLLPQFFRTEANRKFLQATLDQLTQPGVVEKLSGFYGRKTAKSFLSTDTYIPDVSSQRENYQFEPAVVLRDNLENVEFYRDYNDYMNQLSNFGVDTSDHSKINTQTSYAWDPHIDFDKFVNFREYYWLPNGPIPVTVRGQSRSITSTYRVTTVDDGDNVAYVFNDLGERNPTIELYRGQTYRFEIDTPDHPFAFAITRNFMIGNTLYMSSAEQVKPGLFGGNIDPDIYSYGEFVTLPENGGIVFEENLNVSTLFPDGIRVVGTQGEQVANLYIEKGVVEFTVPFNAPNRLFYISQTNIDTSGYIKISDVEENTFLDIENDILGKKYYTSANGVVFSNGLKVSFSGNVEPETYSQGYYYVEGVGDSIKLVPESNLTIPSAYSDDIQIPYDSDAFDRLPYSNASAYAADKDYIIINRASLDRNPWTRYNKWFHRDIIEKSFEYNDIPVNVDETQRAKRPIIEFEAGLKLYKYGTAAKNDVDLVDTFTADVFSTIEGSTGYNIDGVDLVQGMRVLFVADTDVLVKNKIYTVNFITLSGERQISLIPTDDTDPLENETVFVRQGIKNSGKTYYYENNNWKIAQEKTQTNQHPLFDLCCPVGNFYGDLNVFDSSSFSGTKVFSYSSGDGQPDDELGFSLLYRNIENSGDIVFEFNLLTDAFTVQTDSGVINVKTDTGNLRKYHSRTDFDFVNGYSSISSETIQKVVRQYTATRSLRNRFEIDVYDDAGDLNQLKTYVYVNNLYIQRDYYDINRINKKAFINFVSDLSAGDNVIIKTTSEVPKNNNGFYEFPINLEKNPLNENASTFTLGEVIDHVSTIIEELDDFSGIYPGKNNIRDLGYVKNLGKRFIKHTGPMSLSVYHITNRDYNIVKSIEYSKTEYSKFKRLFIEQAETLGFDGSVRHHVDKILQTLNREKSKDKPFYFSDMLGYATGNVIQYTVADSESIYYALSQVFDLNMLTSQSVNVYLNDQQLVYEKDYTFSDEGFVLVTANKNINDTITIVEYSTTDGSYIPPTPTKLGLYPKYIPELLIDDTYQTQEPQGTGPFKIYAEMEDTDPDSGKTGWIYPIYTSKTDAETADTAGTARQIKVKGLGRYLYAPSNSVQIGAQDSEQYDEYPVGYSFIRGHDGSFILAYKDYRDALILEYEKRIYNNIKVNHAETGLDYADFLPGKFRETPFTNEQINTVLLKDFVQWLRYVDNDYTAHDFYDRDNQFTYNYSNMTSDIDGQLLHGFWRGIYRELYDTDAPHSRPWEMLGFSIKPDWWEQTYGPSPYTSNNLILWQDMEQGIIRKPNTEIQIKTQYIRPNLMNYIPVDHQGKLLSPLEIGYAKNFFFRYANANFVFGDQSPVETAWRKSSEFPFAILKAWLLYQPSKVVGMAYDTSRLQKNAVGQYVYKENLLQIQPKSIVFPNTYQDQKRTMSSGLVNYLYNLVASDVLKVYQDYKSNVNGLQVQVGVKLGGFTDKSKMKFILDSKSPSQGENGGVFVPEENYQIFLNTSSPINIASYSGIIVEKTASGYVIRGYNDENPVFRYRPYIETANDPVISVGGVSESTTQWTSNKSFFQGQILEFGGKYYRVIRDYTSGNTFSIENLAQIPEIPIVGGRRAIFRSRWDTRTVKKLAYGTLLPTIQQVVDFILGYEKYLTEQGFKFDYFNVETEFVENWRYSAREFLFWTTQNWAQGTTITLSPAANQLEFYSQYTVVDNIFDDFYDYSVLKSNGLPLQRKFNNVLREGNNFGISTVNTDDGIYNIRLPLVQKEHVAVFDNKTVFDDIIYQPESGYKQDRIRVSGYRSDDWDGSLNIPGFFYDDAKITQWESYKDYATGELVKYKEFYYVALNPVSGTQDFNESNWYRLNEKPESKLYSNFDYRINQFSDFYDLDTDNFDGEQQRLAQHLIGYQKRKYLENIINDDVSQYKFYQGFIQDKGTLNAVEKLFGKLSSTGEAGLQVFEEWAIQTGQYGSVDNIKHIEYIIDEKLVVESPQVFELTQTVPITSSDKIYRILPHEVYEKPSDYDHRPFPTTNLKQYTIDSGYVNTDDVRLVFENKQEMQSGPIASVNNEEYIWLLNNGSSDWNVYQQISTPLYVNTLNRVGPNTGTDETLYEFTTSGWVETQVIVGDIIGIRGATNFGLTGFYSVTNINSNRITVSIPNSINITTFESIGNRRLQVSKLRAVRATDIVGANSLIQDRMGNEQLLWIDDYDSGDWSVIKNNSVYTLGETVTNSKQTNETTTRFTESMVSTSDNRNVFVSSPDYENGIVHHYSRTSEKSELIEQNNIEPPTGLYSNLNTDFGESIAVSDDGKFLAVGIPNASEVLTRFKGTFDPTVAYNKNDIVKFRESLWQANREILPAVGSQSFESFKSYADIAGGLPEDSAQLNLLFAGNPGLPETQTDHILVRAPIDQYNGSKIGDKIVLAWNEFTDANNTRTQVLPWAGNIPELTVNFIEQTHVIHQKVDRVFYITSYVTLPEVGQTVKTDTGTATVRYVAVSESDIVIYVNNINGVFELSGDIYTSTDEFIGFYTENETANVAENLGGFWMIKTGFTYDNGETQSELGRGLVFVDFILSEETRSSNLYINILDDVVAGVSVPSDRQRNSYIGHLSYRGEPGPNGVTDNYKSDLFFIRAPISYTNTLSVGSSFNFSLYDLSNRGYDPTTFGFNFDITNRELTVHDLWDGYIDFDFTRFDFAGFPHEPQVGDVIEDVQTPLDSFGQLSSISSSTSTAQVVFYQRNFNSVRVFVKILTGTWQLLANTFKYEIRRKARNITDVDRVMGEVQDYNNGVVLPNGSIGKFIVVKNTIDTPDGSELFPIVDEPSIKDQEYYFYNSVQVSGTFRLENPPYSQNLDYSQVYNIPADFFGEPSYDSVGTKITNEGAVAIYRKKTNNEYELQTLLTSEYRSTNRGFGRKIKLSKKNNLYTLFVGSVGDEDSSRTQPGSIEIFKHGYTNNDNFVGQWNQNNTYSANDLVEYFGDYYKAKVDILLQNELSISDKTLWKKISWKTGKDEKYMGVFDNSLPYAKDDVVYNPDEDSVGAVSRLYRATTNIGIGNDGPTNSSKWAMITDGLDYLGYLPNLTNNIFYDYTAFDQNSTYNKDDLVEYDGQIYSAIEYIIPSSIENERGFDVNQWELLSEAIREQVFDPAENIDIFSRDFDVSDDGEVLVVSSKQFASDSTVPLTKVLVYRLSTNKYILTQTIDGPSAAAGSTGFGENVRINNNGDTLAITDKLFDLAYEDQGYVYLYKLENGSFQLSQTLSSPTPEDGEMFGNSIEFAEKYLVVGSKNGDMKLPTTFDLNIGTTFDSGFTTFRKNKKDTGQVYVYENINSYYLFSEKLRYDNAIIEFGENLYCRGNHIYVGMPSIGLGKNVGTLLDYRKEKNTQAWNIHRTLVRPVDIDKIRRCYLYNRKDNTIITSLDVIDPIQGRIAAPAEQNLSYKTTYDPAYYNVSSQKTNPDIFWGSEHVGQLWWDISAARFQYAYQGNAKYQKENWNLLQKGKSVVVCEWVESNVLPSEWDRLSAGEQAINSGISGTSLYGDSRYSINFVYDEETKTFSRKYYFWVRNKRIVPNIENRTLSAFDVARLIAQPRLQGYRYLAITGDNRFILNNCDELIYNTDTVLHISYSTDLNKEKNIHSQYQILSDGLDTSVPDSRIERKWFDSLIGFDENNLPVPAQNLTVKQKYGVQDKPRQSMFINRFEALKQVIERVNSVLEKEIITDNRDLSSIQQSEQVPTFVNGFYDIAVETKEELRFVSTNKIRRAVLEPVIENGRLTKINIIDSGRGYKVAPTYRVSGSGRGAELQLDINNLGEITNVDVISSGNNYRDDTQIQVRNFSVLVNSDSELNNRWGIYSRSIDNTIWELSRVQSYNVNIFWEYIDWYDNGYNEFTEVDYTVESSYQLFGLDDRIGDIVKINNIGTGGWLLLEKINNQNTEDYTVSYKTIGRKDGTIKFLDTLYDYGENTIGYDNRSYDSYFYDSNPTTELRIILKAIRDVLFTGSLLVEYNKLFTSSLRYIFNEQKYVDWIFKTSFIKLKHDLGNLFQDITFNNDKINDYQSYVKEVKPYKTVIREFINGYTSIDESRTSVTDFDLSPWYRENQKKILPSSITIANNQLIDVEPKVTEYPRKHWLDNVGYGVSEIIIGDAGSGYTMPPKVQISGGGGSGATAVAYLGYGKITSIKITNPGSGYTSAPNVNLEGSVIEGGSFARATAVLGPSRVRRPSITIKFDRTSGIYEFESLDTVENFNGTGARFIYDLEWPMSLKVNDVTVTVDGRDLLRSEYFYENVKNKETGYTRTQGKITFTRPPALDSNIQVKYKKDISMLSAADRIRVGYNPADDMLGSDVSQLMEGVDYGGVEVRSFDFGGETGWDTQEWYSDSWDTFDSSYTDMVFSFDGSTTILVFENPLEQDTIYNVYLNGTRIDDPFYGTSQQTNNNALMLSLVGDGSTATLDLDELGVRVGESDILVIRKIESDGSFIPNSQDYDTDLSGGDFSYTTATGLLAEDIIVDGDGFVTPTNSGGPEELVPGQLLDTLDICVETRQQNGQEKIYVQNFVMQTGNDTYNIQGLVKSSKENIIVKVNNIILNRDEYELDLESNTVKITNVIDQAKLSIINIGTGYNNIVDVGTFVADGSSSDYSIPVKYTENMVVNAFVNGVRQSALILADMQDTGSLIRFLQKPTLDASVYYYITESDKDFDISFTTRDTFVSDGSTASFDLSIVPYVQLPLENKIIVKHNNIILHPGYNIEYTVNNVNQQNYKIEDFQYKPSSISTSDIEVYLNYEKLESASVWVYDSITNNVTIFGRQLSIGDNINIRVVSDSEYTITDGNLVLKQTPVENDVIEIFSFSNHDIKDIHRSKYQIVSRITLTASSEDYTTYTKLAKGEISLKNPADDVNQVWVNKNGVPLTPSVDYYLKDNNLDVQLAELPEENDIIDVIHFSKMYAKPMYKYRQFKDMLNRTHYKVIDSSVTELVQPLNWYDVSVEVADGSVLSEPDRAKNLPGIIFVDGERIEYFIKQGNTLRHIRRGTLGTGTKNVYETGTAVVDQGVGKTIPYKDSTKVQMFTGNGVTDTFSLDFTPESINEFEVFSAGKRLNKNQKLVFNNLLAMDSPQGDELLDADFVWNSENNTITLTDVPAQGTKVTVVRKTGKVWTEIGKTLADSDTDIGRYLVQKSINSI